jgi:hypothetical protein
VSLEGLPKEVIQKFGNATPRKVEESGEIDLSPEALERISKRPFKPPVNPRGLPINWGGLVEGNSGALVEKEILDGRNPAGPSS